MPRPRNYPEELLERGARLVLESGRPIAQVAADLGVHREALRKRVRQAEADAGERRDLLTSSERERLLGLEREVKELRRANEILKAASVFFAKELERDAASPPARDGPTCDVSHDTSQKPRIALVRRLSSSARGHRARAVRWRHRARGQARGPPDLGPDR
jgi:transposase